MVSYLIGKADKKKVLLCKTFPCGDYCKFRFAKLGCLRKQTSPISGVAYRQFQLNRRVCSRPFGLIPQLFDRIKEPAIKKGTHIEVLRHSISDLQSEVLLVKSKGNKTSQKVYKQK